MGQMVFSDGMIKSEKQINDERIKNYKFKEHEGEFKLNGVIVKYKFRPFRFSVTHHIEFNSDKVPNLLTETGYRSWFFYPDEVEEFNTIKEVIEDYVKFRADGKYYEIEWL